MAALRTLRSGVQPPRRPVCRAGARALLARQAYRAGQPYFGSTPEPPAGSRTARSAPSWPMPRLGGMKDQAAAGVLPHRRFGKHYRFTRADVAEIVRITAAPVKPPRRRVSVVDVAQDFRAA